MWSILLLFGIFSFSRCEQFDIEHSFNGQSTWSLRGHVAIEKPGGIKYRAREPAKLTAEESSALRQLLSSGGYYYLRLVRPNDGAHLVTSVSACSIVTSKFKDQVVLGLNRNNTVVSLDYIPDTYSCDEKAATMLAKDSEFKTLASTITPQIGAVPIKEEVIKPKAAGGAEEQSFFSKYWMYIVPVVVITVVQLLQAVVTADEGGSK